MGRVTNAVTDSAGRYSGKVRTGRHEIKAEAPGYAPAYAKARVTAGDTTTINFQLLPEDYVSDSIHRLVIELKSIEMIPWWNRSEPDSAAIRRNNETVVAAVSAFHRRRRFPRPSYSVHGHDSYLVIGRGKCRLIREPDMPLGYRMDDVDSLRLAPGHNDARKMPAWFALPEYTPLRLEAFFHDGHWNPVVVQAPILKL
jgi:hypothetical protein